MHSENHFVDDLAPFRSALTRVQYAEESGGAIEAKLNAFREQIGKTIVQRTNPETGETTIYVRFSHPVPLGIRYRYTLILTELRHALDDALNDAVKQLGCIGPRPDYFPISSDAVDFDGKIKGLGHRLPKELIAYLRTIAPYKDGKDEVLWALSKFSGAGKHGRFLPLTIAVDRTVILEGTQITPLKPSARPNPAGEFAIAKGVLDKKTPIGVAPKIVIDSELLGFSFRSSASVRQVTERVRDIVEGLEEVTAKILAADA